MIKQTDSQLATPEPSVALMLQKVIEGGVTVDNVAALEQLLYREPLPPNQSFQLPSDEQPTENQPTYINAQ